MLGMLINTSNLPWAPNTWKLWVDHIMKNKTKYSFKRAALVHTTGNTASSSVGFILPPQEVMAWKFYFDGSNKSDSLSIKGKTYVIKAKTDTHIIAFNGRKYYIISRSKSMYVVALCESRAKCDDAARWINKLTTRLIEKDF